MISMARMPCSIAGKIDPICHQPDFLRRVLWTENIHPHKSGRTIDKMGTKKKSLLDGGIHVVGYDKPAQDANLMRFQWNLFSEELLLLVYAHSAVSRDSFLRDEDCDQESPWIVSSTYRISRSPVGPTVD